MDGYYTKHDKGEALLELDLDNLVNHSVGVLVTANKRIEYSEQREGDLIAELENARSIQATLEEKIHNTHVNSNDKKD